MMLSSSYPWLNLPDLEDCAVCRRTLKDGTIYDRVLGCVAFSLKRTSQNSASIMVNGRATNPYVAQSSPPGRLWNKAFKDWVDTTNDHGRNQ